MDRQKIERSIKGLSEWQMHVQAESDIDRDISTAIEALKTQLSQEGTTKDAISRQAAIDLFPNDVLEWDTLNGYIAPHVARRLIEQLPPAQPERQKGEWIDYTEDGYVECPFCHSATNCDGNKDELHFCFSCGADMKGEPDETD